MIKINIQVATYTISGLQVHVKAKGEAKTADEQVYYDFLKAGIDEAIKTADAVVTTPKPAAAPLAVIQGVQLQPLEPGAILLAPEAAAEAKMIELAPQAPKFSEFATHLIAALEKEHEIAKGNGDTLDTPVFMAERHAKLVKDFCAEFSLRALRYQHWVAQHGPKLTGGRN